MMRSSIHTGLTRGYTEKLGRCGRLYSPPEMMTRVQSVSTLLVAVLLALAVVLEIARRLIWRVFPRRRFSWRARKVRRWLGRLELVLVLLALLSAGQIARESGLSVTAVGSIIEAMRTEYAEFFARFESRQRLNGKTQTARVWQVKDGDSLVLRMQSGGFSDARLYGIDAPEYDQSHGTAAKIALAWKLTWRKVEFLEVDIDRYGRLVIVLYRDGRNINEEMVCEGHAWWYKRYARTATNLSDCEKSARERGVGLWGEENPVAPWRWRQGAAG